MRQPLEEIRDAYLEGWKLGLKALAIYRDGSKGSQPLSTKAESSDLSPSSPISPVALPCRGDGPE